jgi:thioesterase domain-containing protein
VVLLGGHTAGGVLAHELARALEARGRETAVVMIDAPSPPAIRRQAIRSADDVLRELGSFATASSPAYQALVTALGDGSPLGAVVLATWQALQRCEPRPIRGELVYVAAAEQRDARDARAGAWWMDLGEGAFSLHRSPGDHFTMMDEPQVQPLARLIRRALADWLPRPADE